MRRKSLTAKIFGYFTYIIVCIFIGVGIYYISEWADDAKFSPNDLSIAKAESPSASPTTSPTPTPVPTDGLGGAVMKSLDGTKGSYAVAIKNLKTGETFNLNEHQQFDTGSLYKLWVMTETYKQIEQGAISPDDVLSSSIPELNRIFDIDPANAELKDGSISLTVKQALNQMITISHNYAALLLTQKNKLSTIKQWLADNNFTESSVGGDPKTTASDMLTFFDKLQSGQLGNAESTQQMLELLKNQKLNNKLPANLPDEIDVAHKTGEIGYFTHDAGIVYTPKGDYIIVVLSQSDMPSAAEDRIADLSKAVYEYFQSK